MPDNVDFIQEQQAELLERQINAARVKHCGASALIPVVHLIIRTGCAKAPGHMQITKSLRIPDVVISTWLVVSSRSWELNLQSLSE